MKRSCVAANEQPAALNDRPQLGQVQFTALHDTGRGGAELLRAPRQRFARWPRDRMDRS